MLDAPEWIDQDPELAMTLPSKYFYDEAIFNLEKDRIFMNAWHVIGHKNEISKPGDYVVCDLFEQSVIITHGKDGKIRGFHNVCQHRGNRLVAGGRGAGKSVFRCEYHSWCYNLDGSLRGAPRSENIREFDISDFSCPSVRVEEFAGFLYFNLDPQAPSLSDLFQGADEEIRQIFPDLDDMQLIEINDVEVSANWKVIMDNSIEGYHFTLSGPCHVGLGRLINFSEYKLQQHDKWWTYRAPSNLAAEEPYGATLDKLPKADDSFFNIGMFPHNTFYRFPFSDFLGVFTMIPVSAEKSILRFGYYASDPDLSDVITKCVNWMNTELGPEDIDLNITTQKGLRSLGYDQGRYMIDPARSNESEHLVHHFHTLVYRAIHGDLSR